MGQAYIHRASACASARANGKCSQTTLLLSLICSAREGMGMNRRSWAKADISPCKVQMA